MGKLIERKNSPKSVIVFIMKHSMGQNCISLFKSLSLLAGISDICIIKR